MKSKRSLWLLVLIPVILLTGACTAKQDIYIEKSGSGTVGVDIELASYLTEVITQIQSLLQPENPLPEDAPFFNVEAITSDFAKRDGVELIRLETPTPESLSGEFRFDDVDSLFQKIEAGSPESRLIRFETRGEVSELFIRISRESVEALLQENPSLNNPLVANFGPTTTEGLTDNDYLDMMEFALGSESRRGLQDSTLDLTVRVEGRILEQTGGTLINDQTVRFSVPVLPFLMLTEPLVYSLSYQ